MVSSNGLGDGEVVELPKIAKGHLPRVKIEYDKVKAELNSCKAETSNAVRTYQQFVDRNILLKKRVDELLLNISKLEARENELQKTITGLEQQQSELRENNADNPNLNPEVEQEDINSTNDVLIPQPNMTINYHQNENETYHYSPQVEPSSMTLIFDTRDLF